MLTFHVPGNPKALKRHRTTKSGHRYDPSANDKADFLAKCMQHRPEKPLEGPLWLACVFCFPRPKNHFNSKGELKPSAPAEITTRPDLDNLVKLVVDALNGVFWRDDRQITTCYAIKKYENPYWHDVGVQVMCDHCLAKAETQEAKK